MMKHIFWSIGSMVALLFLLAGCDNEKTEILASRIQYDVPIYSDDPQLDWWVNNLEGSKRDPFSKRLLEAAQNGDVRVYDYFNEPLTPGQVMSLMVDTIFQTLIRPYEPYEEYDTVIYYRIDHRDITRVRFLEEWTWDPESMEMEKEVLAIAPVMVIEYGGQEYNRPLYWIYIKDGYPEELLK